MPIAAAVGAVGLGTLFYARWKSKIMNEDKAKLEVSSIALSTPCIGDLLQCIHQGSISIIIHPYIYQLLMCYFTSGIISLCVDVIIFIRMLYSHWCRYIRRS